jgi:dihydroneopterin aldolase
MEFYSYHGVFPEERKLGQRFIVDVVLDLDLQVAGQTDKMEDSIDYGRVYQLTKKIVEGDAQNLVESVAEKIANELLSTFEKLSSCTIKLIKPDPPIPGNYQSVAVEIYRERSE